MEIHMKLRTSSIDHKLIHNFAQEIPIFLLNFEQKKVYAHRFYIILFTKISQ